MVLPLNAYTEWYWKIDLHNLMHFLSLRFDYHAQYEIRVYAEVMLKILKKWVPLTYEAFISHRLENISLSKHGIEFIKNLIHGKKIIKLKFQKEKRDELKKDLVLNNFYSKVIIVLFFLLSFLLFSRKFQ